MIQNIKFHSILGILFLLFAVCMFSIHCEKKSTEPEKTAAQLTDDGWKAFSVSNYTAAASIFLAAIAKDPIYTDAYNGLGWSFARLDSLTKAKSNFDKAIQQNSALVDAYVGRAGVLKKMNDHNAATSDALQALQLNATYSFSRDNRISYTDVRLLLSECYYNLQRYTDAQAEVDRLRSILGLSIINWLVLPINVDGTNCSSYPEALLFAIENLRDLV